MSKSLTCAESLSFAKETLRWKNVLFFFLLLLAGKTTVGQYWLPVGDGLNRDVKRLDSCQGKLYAFGNFTASGNGIPVNYAAIYNGTQWDSISFLGDNYTGCIVEYNTDLVYGFGPIFRWNGLKIDTIALLNTAWGTIFGMFQFNNDLVVYGSFDSIGGVRASKIAKWNGAGWSAFDTTYWYGGPISSAVEYQGQLYIGGNMVSYDGTLRRLARWNGNKWLPVDYGIIGGLAVVNCFEIYKNDLYIGGMFSMATGSPGNAILRWTGSEWGYIGDGMTQLNSQVFDLQVYNDELYAAGNFGDVDGNTGIAGLAKWDGVKWCGVGQKTGPVPHNSVSCMAVFNNELYIGGSFTTLDGDTVNNVAKWVGGSFTDICTEPSAVNNIPTQIELLLYPNPTTHTLTLSIPNFTEALKVTVTNTNGQLMQQQDMLTANCTFDVANLPKGMYYVTVTGAQGLWVKRFVKQ